MSWKQFMEQHWHNCLHNCNRLFSLYREEGDAFMSSTVAGGETEIHHYEADGKHQRMKYKSLPTAGKRSDTPLFWDSRGSILEALSEMGVTLNNSRYSEILS